MNIFKNRSFRKTIVLGVLLIIITTFIFGIINSLQYKKYLKTVNSKIDVIINKVIEKYPEITEDDIMEILRSEETPQNNLLEKYGYDSDIAYIKQLDELIETNKKQNIIYIVVVELIALGIYLVYVISQEKKIKEINL